MFRASPLGGGGQLEGRAGSERVVPSVLIFISFDGLEASPLPGTPIAYLCAF